MTSTGSRPGAAGDTTVSSAGWHWRRPGGAALGKFGRLLLLDDDALPKFTGEPPSTTAVGGEEEGMCRGMRSRGGPHGRLSS
jgi:hypothetical protein